MLYVIINQGQIRRTILITAIARIFVDVTETVGNSYINFVIVIRGRVSSKVDDLCWWH